jgi:hypothetical protein
MTKEIEAQVQWGPAPAPGLTPGDLADLGAQAARLGVGVRELVAEAQQMGTQVALAFTPKVMAHVERIVRERTQLAMMKVRLMPGAMGSNYIRRDQVMLILSEMTQQQEG